MGILAILSDLHIPTGRCNSYASSVFHNAILAIIFSFFKPKSQNCNAVDEKSRKTLSLIDEGFCNFKEQEPNRQLTS